MPTFSEKNRTPLSGKSASYVSPNKGLNGLQCRPSDEEYPDTANAATFKILRRLFPYKCNRTAIKSICRFNSLTLFSLKNTDLMTINIIQQSKRITVSWLQILKLYMRERKFEINKIDRFFNPLKTCRTITCIWIISLLTTSWSYECNSYSTYHFSMLICSI